MNKRHQQGGILRMMPVLVLAFFVAQARASDAVPAAAPPTWRVLTHSLSGQVDKREGQLLPVEHGGKRAYYLALVQALVQELKLPAVFDVVPLARGLLTVQSSPNIAFFNLDRTAEREHTVRWVGPISREEDLLYSWKGAPVAIRSLDAARHIPTCVVNGNVHDRILTQAGFTQLTRSSSYVACIRMLRHGHVQLVALARENLHRVAEAAEIAPDMLGSTGVTLGSTAGFIALSLSTPDAEVRRWQSALERLVASGRAAALRARYWL